MRIRKEDDLTIMEDELVCKNHGNRDHIRNEFERLEDYPGTVLRRFKCKTCGTKLTIQGMSPVWNDVTGRLRISIVVRYEEPNNG